MMEFDWTVLMELALFVLAALACVYLIPWLKTKLGEAQFNALWERVCILVQAAQKLFPKVDGVKTGDLKKEYVCTRLVEDYGVEIDDAVDSMIEAAVNELT